MKIDTKNNNLKFLFLLLSGDILFITFHIGHILTSGAKTLAETSDSVFALGKDLGLAESYMYVKEYWVILLLAYLTWTRKKLMYFAWCLLFFYIIFDDLFQMHERVGGILAKNLEMVPMFGLRGQDFGELLFSGLAGLVLLTLIAIAYLKSDPDLRKICRHFIFLLFALVIFGVVFDMVQILVMENHTLYYIVGIIEDGGEMLILSFFVWYVRLLSEEKTNASPFNVF